MAVTVSAVRVVVEEEEAEDVGEQAEGADDADELWVLDGLGLDEAIDGLEEDGETQGDEEDAVDEGTEGLSALPLSPAERRDNR